MGSRKILNISLPRGLYLEINEMAKTENKSKAELAREILQEHIKRRKRWDMIRNWGKATAKRHDLDAKDIEKITHQSRGISE